MVTMAQRIEALREEKGLSRPAFAAALREAAENGVTVLAMDCAVTADSMVIRNPVEVRL